MSYDVLFFFVAAAGLAGQVFDSYTTDTALAHGWKETVGPTAWLANKIGVTGMLLVKCAGLGVVAPALLAILGVHYGVGYAAATIVSAVAAGVGFYAGIVNYKRLKAAKVI